MLDSVALERELSLAEAVVRRAHALQDRSLVVREKVKRDRRRWAELKAEVGLRHAALVPDGPGRASTGA